MKLNRRGIVGLAVAAAVAIGGGAAFAASDSPAAPTPIGTSVTATEAYSDSISNITAVFGSLATPITAADTQVPVGDDIQFGATDSRGFAIHWSTVPAGFISSATGLTVALPAVGAVPFTAKVEATDAILGDAKAIATVTLSQGAAPGEDSVTIIPDTVVLPAPQNSNGQVSFPEPAGVTVTMADLPAGVVASDGVLSSGTAVPGIYPNLFVTATDASGASATEDFTAVVKDVYAAVPKLSDGSATFVGTSREDVSYVQSGAASWDHFTIVGPGAINGHQGWVYGNLGLNTAVYGGLEYKHGYTVYYQPVTSQGGSTPVPGSHYGYVYFVS
jgi:hypothetical protein